MSHDRGCFRCNEDHPHARVRSGECRLIDCPYKEKPVGTVKAAVDQIMERRPIPSSQLTPAQIKEFHPETRQHILKLTWETIHTAIDSLIFQLDVKQYSLIVAVARGGLIPATMIANKLNLNVETFSARSYEGTRRTLQKPTELVGWKNSYGFPDVLIVDDIVDSGATLKAIKLQADNKSKFLSIVTKQPYKHELFFAQVDPSVWIQFPWEGAPK